MSSAGMYGPPLESEKKAKATRVKKKEKPILEQVAIFLTRMIERDCNCCCASVDADKMLRKVQNG